MSIKKNFKTDLRAFLFIIILIVSACSDSKVEKFDPDKSIYSPRDYIHVQTMKEEGSFLRDLFNIEQNSNTKKRNKTSNLSINPYLWKASLNILSSTMPLVSIDSSSGIIISDWYSLQEKPEERIKISVLVNTQELRADGVVVKVFKQTLRGNSWINTKTNPNIAIKLERKIVQKAGVLSNQID